MSDIRVITPGLLTTIQDKGRIGYQQFGMPVAGAMDEYSLRLGNILLQNREYEAALEVTMIGPELQFNIDTVIAITGGNLQPKINDIEVGMWRTLKINKGDKLSFGKVKEGIRSYICFYGELNITEVMGSKSTYAKAGIGGVNGRALKIGDKLNLIKKEENFDYILNKKIKECYIPKFTGNYDIRVILGPQKENFTEKGINTFLSSNYEVTDECDRMGYRLSGDKIEHKEGADIISDGIALGSVQVPGHGMPIIMMADRQTTGGYTKIATVISSDISILAQAKPGDKINFNKVSVKEAHNILKEYEYKIVQIKNSIEDIKDINIEILRKKAYKVKVNGESFNVLVEEVK
ncbi:biotin-dependent carboxyltransferase family protein [Clostridium lundense]|uniref:5-oxoprolinase subunit C family protein n=1 Tax=Clostridium lundense TaxID=319475 RepID=UPI000484A8B7|nr:biotin-dependent carboxyltransferase family protein [Clostridium lundense]